jgi:hypothetical protein
MYSDVRPKFVKRFAELGEAVVRATQSYVTEVRSQAFPSAEHSFSGVSPKAKPALVETGTAAVVDAKTQAYGPAGDELV